MPQFYFHILDDIVTADEEGLNLPDVDTARRQAREAAADLVAEHIRSRGRLDPNHRIDVADDEGNQVFSLVFGDLIDGFRRDGANNACL